MLPGRATQARSGNRIPAGVGDALFPHCLNNAVSDGTPAVAPSEVARRTLGRIRERGPSGEA